MEETKKVIRMPRLKPDMETGILCAWNVECGDTVEKGDILFEVETDKVVTQIESTYSGKVAEIFADEGDAVAVDAPVMSIE